MAIHKRRGGRLLVLLAGDRRRNALRDRLLRDRRVRAEAVTARKAAIAAGSTWAGRRSRRRWSTRGKVLGDARRHSDLGRARRRRRSDGGGAAGGGRGPASDRGPGRRRGRLARRRRREDGHVAGAATSRLGGQLPARARRSPRALGSEVRVGNDVQVATEAEFQLGAGARVLDRCSASSGAPASAAASSSTASPGSAAARRARSATWSSSAAAPAARAAAGAAWRPTRAVRRWKPRRGASTKRA